MIDRLLGIIAPHHCSGCGFEGTLLCDNCKYDIIADPYEGCAQCGVMAPSGVCGRCRPGYARAWVVGYRRDALERLVSLYKFERAQRALYEVAELIADRIPSLPSNVVVVPIPTIAPHIRQRGYDHTKVIAKQVAKNKKVSWGTPLRRITSTKQLGATRAQRIKQAQQAFAVDPRQITPNTIYLLIDDVVTTGATVAWAARKLREAGAEEVWLAAIARQPLDER